MRHDGLEQRILRQLPCAFVGVVVPGAAAALAGDELNAILVLAVMVAWALLLLPLALGCLIVCAMKGRVRTADSYPLPELQRTKYRR